MKGKLRCAVYTRKSSEEGLEQDFNSLDAQREACLAYIQSQKGEGWTASTRRYDDGGWSGGSMERPALKQLLADIEAGLVNVVVVYKVDRLTRSLSDFARIVDIFDRRGVSFVSVTQAFNTTTSMGRLTLNVLLSFAQFEREVTGERIRDKIAASKAKGMWMGGVPPLGYLPKDRTLVIDPAEARIVQHIFARYLELRSVHTLARELQDQGVRSKQRITAKGERNGGAVLTRGALLHLLRNRLYLGEIVHKDKVYPGQHAGMIERETFDAVQRMLSQRANRREAAGESHAPLLGLIFDAAGNRMTPTHARGRSGKRYAYYTSAPLQVGGALPTGATGRISAPQVESLVLDRLRLWSGRADDQWPTLLPSLRRIELHPNAMRIGIAPPAHERWELRIEDPDVTELLADRSMLVTVPRPAMVRSGRVWISADQRSARITPDKMLVAALRRAHRTLADCGIDLLDRAGMFEQAKGIDDPYYRAMANLAFLAPDIQAAILTGRQRPGLTLSDILKSELPVCWTAQRTMLGM
jgi:DNA invertase Pin-like site-specific DNA recombinase